MKFWVKLTLRWRVVLYYIRNRVKLKRLKQNKAEFSILGWSITKGCSLSLSKIMQSPEKISTVKKNNQCLNRILQEKHFWVYNGEEEYYPWSLLVNFASVIFCKRLNYKNNCNVILSTYLYKRSKNINGSIIVFMCKKTLQRGSSHKKCFICLGKGCFWKTDFDPLFVGSFVWVRERERIWKWQGRIFLSVILLLLLIRDRCRGKTRLLQ